MTKVVVFNFKTMQFEQASKDEGNDLLSLIDAMNSDCAAQQSAHPTVCQCGEDCIPMLGEDTCVRCDLPLAHSG
jgi:hypothetical protein